MLVKETVLFFTVMCISKTISFPSELVPNSELAENPQCFHRLQSSPEDYNLTPHFPNIHNHMHEFLKPINQHMNNFITGPGSRLPMQNRFNNWNQNINGGNLASMLPSAQLSRHVGMPQTWQNRWPHYNWNQDSSNVAIQTLPAQTPIGHPMRQGINQISPSGTPWLQGEFSRYPQTQQHISASPTQGYFSRNPQTQPHIASPAQQDSSRYSPVSQPSAASTAAPPKVTLYTRPIASNGQQKTEDTDEDYEIDIRKEVE